MLTKVLSWQCLALAIWLVSVFSGCRSTPAHEQSFHVKVHNNTSQRVNVQFVPPGKLSTFGPCPHKVRYEASIAPGEIWSSFDVKPSPTRRTMKFRNGLLVIDSATILDAPRPSSGLYIRFVESTTQSVYLSDGGLPRSIAYKSEPNVSAFDADIRSMPNPSVDGLLFSD